MRRRLSAEEIGSREREILDALQRAIGNANGLTRPTSKALVDITNSTILDYFLSISASDIDATNAKDIAFYIHQSRGEKSEEASKQFSDSLWRCLSECTSQFLASTRDDADKFMNNIQFRRHIDERAKRADAAIFAILSKLKDKNGVWLPSNTVGASAIAQQVEIEFDPLLTYSRAVARTLNSVDVHGASGDVLQVPLDDIYVDVPVSRIARDRNFNHYLDIRRRIPRDVVATNWNVTYSLFDKSVLLGDPGGGKSTLSKKLCLECARRFGEAQSRLPIFIQLRTYIARAAEDDRYSLVQHIFDIIASTQTDANLLSPEASVLYHLRIGAAFVVADGLDEVLTAANRSRVIRELLVFAKSFPLCTMLVTSRYVGYESQPVTGFSHFGVDLLDDNAIDKIFMNVSKVVIQKDESEISTLLPTFRSDCRRKAAELIRSPLLLTLIVIIYNRKSEVPDNRAGLYSFCAELLFDRWDRYRQIVPELPERYRLFDLFKHLSSLLFENEKYGGRINKTDLEAEAKSFFRNDYVDNKEGRSLAAARHMVEHLTGRAWILHEVGEDIFEFTHRTFLEFFYARHLEAKYESTPQLVSTAIPSILVGQRSVPNHLALQIRTKDKRSASSRVADGLADALQMNPQNQELLSFCLESIGYILPDAESLDKFVRRLAPCALSSDDKTFAIRLLCSDNPLGSLIIKSAEEFVFDRTAVTDVVRFTPTLHKLMRASKQETAEIEEQRRNLATTYLSLISKKQRKSPYVCKVIFDLGGEIDREAMRVHGLKLWYNRHTDFPQLALARDARKMVSSAKANLIETKTETTSALLLAKILQPYCFANMGRFQVDMSLHHAGGSAMDDYLGAAELTFDQNAWRDDLEALELYAFCLALYVETNWFSIHKDIAKRIRFAFTDLVDLLEKNSSNNSTIYAQWIEGGCAFLLNKTFNSAPPLQLIGHEFDRQAGQSMHPFHIDRDA